MDAEFASRLQTLTAPSLPVCWSGGHGAGVGANPIARTVTLTRAWIYKCWSE
jgi:hypothetical protein